MALRSASACTQPPDDGYMVAYFLGGATSAATSALYSTSGWNGACALGAGTATLALGLWFGQRAHGRLVAARQAANSASAAGRLRTGPSHDGKVGYATVRFSGTSYEVDIRIV